MVVEVEDHGLDGSLGLPVDSTLKTLINHTN